MQSDIKRFFVTHLIFVFCVGGCTDKTVLAAATGKRAR
jgi:hypothetical protein